MQPGASVSREITCPKTMVGRIIGRGGDTIKGLQRQYTVSIQIDQNQTPCRCVAGTGRVTLIMFRALSALELIRIRRPAGLHGGV